MDNIVVIRIKERSFQDNVFNVEVSIQEKKDESEEQTVVSLPNPYDEKTERLLEWHFEQYIRQPYENNKVKETVNAIEQYGQLLFQQLFSGKWEHRFRSILQDCRPENIIIEIIGDEPLFQAIYWESLRAPWQADPLAAHGTVFLRKNTRKSDIKPVVKESPTINLLIVTARPNEENDVAYRAIQRPIVELIEKTETSVRLHILRPGTYEALIRHLDRKAGHYHVIHFDLHGSLLDYTAYRQYHQAVEKLPAGNALFNGRFGLKELPEDIFGNSKKAFIFFESEEKGVAVPVDAEQLADLLEHKHIPICVLNACQSAKQDGAESQTSMGRVLIQKGIQLVLAMRYSVSVTAAEIMMGQLYHHLYQQEQPEQCIARSRQELYRRKKRKALYNYHIELEDWLLPVVYQNGKPVMNLRSFTMKEEELDVSQRQLPEEVQQNLPYGFLGRDLDILKIEKNLLLRSNILLLQGMGGTGKTTLLKYLCHWWTRTGFVEKVFYFGYDVKAYTLNEILHYIAQKVYTDDTEWRLFNAKKPDVQEDNIVKEFKKRPYTLVLDNAESITGEKLAIPNTLPPAERQVLKRFLGRLKGGLSHVIIGSRAGEDWLKSGTFENNVYLLRGLDHESASDFAQCILYSINVPLETVVDDPHFQRLMKLISGYPLALKAILPNLKNKTPERILKELGEGNIDLDKGNAQERTESIIKCIEYAHSNLSPGAQQLLLCLAPFQTVVNVNPKIIQLYFDELKKEEQFQSYPFDQLETVVQEAVQNGFMQEAIPGKSGGIMILQPVFTFFLKNKLYAEESQLLLRLQTAFISFYQEVGKSLNRLLESREAEEREYGLIYTSYEYENFYQALDLSLEQEGSIREVYHVMDQLLSIKQLNEQRLLLAKMVCERMQQYNDDSFTPALDLEFLNAKLGLSVAWQDLKKPFEAQKVYEEILVYWELKSTSLEGYSKGVIYQNLGNVFEAQGQHSESLANHEKALLAFENNGDVLSQAMVHSNMGIVLRNLEKYDEAHEHYQKALDIYIQEKDVYSEGELYGGMGNLYNFQENYSAAEEYYQKALAIFIKYNNLKNQGSTYLNLGVIAKEQQDYMKARRYSNKALEIRVQLGDIHGQAMVYFTLGTVSIEIEEYGTAREYYEKALVIFKQYKDGQHIGKVYQSLGIICRRLQDYTVAKEYYEISLLVLLQYPEDTNSILNLMRGIYNLTIETKDKSFGQTMLEKALAVLEGDSKKAGLKLLEEINQL